MHLLVMEVGCQRMPAARVKEGEDGGVHTADGGGTVVAPEDHRDLHFQSWPAAAEPATVGRRLVQVFLSEDISAHPRHYKVACAFRGALSVSAVLGDRVTLDALIAKYEPFRSSYSDLLASQGHVDENVFGIVPLQIAEETKDPVILAEGLSIADHQREYIALQKRFAIDDMFMITALQVQAYRASGNPQYLELAASVMVEYLSRLQQSDGLFHHHEDFPHKWARGNGWFAAGMAELVAELPETNANYPAIRLGYDKMMRGLLRYQIQTGTGVGLWKQVLDSDDVRNWPETSGSAMFTYAFVIGVRSGWLDSSTYGLAARAAWLALVAKLSVDGQLQDISDWAYKPLSHEGGPTYAADEENYYFQRPRLSGDNHGQAPLLWSAAALLK